MDKEEYFTESAFAEKYLFKISKRIYDGKSKFQKIDIIENEKFGKILFLDNIENFAVSDEFIYHETIVHPAMMTLDDVKKVLVIGGGDGGVIREIFRYKDISKVVMVDIDKEVIEVSKKFLPELSCDAFDDPRLDLIIGDGRKYVEETDEKFDLIIIDLSDPIEGGPAQKLFTKEFYDIIKSKLNDKGGIVVQSEDITCTKPESHAKIYRTLSQVFDVVRPMFAFIPSFHVSSTLTFCSDDKDPLKIESEDIDKKLKQLGDMRYYNNDMHKGLFSIPNYVKEEYDSSDDITTDANIMKYIG